MQKIISNIAFVLKEYHFFILAEFFHKIAISIDKKNFVPLFKYANFLIERKKYTQAEKIYFEITYYSKKVGRILMKFCLRGANVGIQSGEKPEKKHNEKV